MVRSLASKNLFMASFMDKAASMAFTSSKETASLGFRNFDKMDLSSCSFELVFKPSLIHFLNLFYFSFIFCSFHFLNQIDLQQDFWDHQGALYSHRLYLKHSNNCYLHNTVVDWKAVPAFGPCMDSLPLELVKQLAYWQSAIPNPIS